MKEDKTMEKLSLADFRRNHRMTQQELANAIGVSRNYITLVENGKKPFSDKLRQKLSKVSIISDNQTEPRLEPPAACPMCAAKDKELNQSMKIIEMQAKTIADLTCIVKNIKEDNDLNEPVARASGAGNGLKNSPLNKKGA